MTWRRLWGKPSRKHAIKFGSCDSAGMIQFVERKLTTDEHGRSRNFRDNLIAVPPGHSKINVQFRSRPGIIKQMSDASDMDLVREYAHSNSEAAFAEIVR